MKRTRDAKSWPKHDLPVDLWSTILSRFPAKHLLRFRCVSKSWQSLIDDPNFCQLHLKNFTNTCNETNLFVTQYERSEEKCVVRCSNTFKTKVRLNPLDSICGYSGKWNVCCAMDGIVMIRFCSPTPVFILWNPSIRKARPLPLPPPVPEGRETVDFDIGFDPVINDYKVVRFFKCGNGCGHLDAIYSIGTGLWKAIDVGKESFSRYFSVPSAWGRICFMGALYFIAFNLDLYDYELVLFHLSNDVFASISLPVDGNIKLKGFMKITPVDGGSSLGIVSLLPTEGGMWVLENSTDSPYWIKRFTFASRIPDLHPYEGSSVKFLFLKKNGDMVLYWRKLVSSYNLETNEEKTLLCNGRGLYMVSVYCYVESLLLLNG